MNNGGVFSALKPPGIEAVIQSLSGIRYCSPLWTAPTGLSACEESLAAASDDGWRDLARDQRGERSRDDNWRQQIADSCGWIAGCSCAVLQTSLYDMRKVNKEPSSCCRLAPTMNRLVQRIFLNFRVWSTRTLIFVNRPR